MSTRYYILQVNDPPLQYPARYFPRKYATKQQALEAGRVVVTQGATLARIECPNGGEVDIRPGRMRGAK